MDTFAQAMRNIGPMRLAIMGGVLLGIVGFLIFLTTRLSAPGHELLYGELEPADSARVVQALDQAGISYSLRQNGSQIFVPGERVGPARLLLADQGLPSGGSIGYEIFDNQDALGSTNFQQQVSLVRALEGEISRTIQTIDAVKQARVHLVMPKRELFSRENQQPSASIFLRMRTTTRLDREQVAAIRHLVAAAVPSLNPSRISIVDNKGSLLARGFDEGGQDGAAGDAKADDRRKQFEAKLAQTIEELLEKTVGFGKVRAEVTADMDFDRISTQQEEFNPDGQVVRSTQTITENANSRDAEGIDPVTVGANLPDPAVDGAGGNQSSETAENRTEEVVNFEISKTVTNHVREVGTVNRLSVAVLVDGNRVENDDGDLVYEPRSEAEMELLATLVRSAIGFNPDRGDTVEVINMQFAEFVEPEEQLEFFFGLGKNDLLRLAEALVLGIVAILIILLVVRPLISRALETLPGQMAAAQERLLADQTGVAPALAGPGAPGVPAPAETEAEEEQFEELIDIDRVEGRVKASSVKKVGEIVEKHPEEALSIIRAWMYQEG